MIFLAIYFGHQTFYGASFQHSNSAPHVSRHTTQVLASKVKILPWPSLSPDLNPIEHILDTCVRGRVSIPANVHELFKALRQEWVAIKAQMIHNMIQSD